MKSQIYRLTTPTLGILSVNADGQRIPVTVPLNAIVTVQGDTFDASHLALVDVTWEDKTIMMFVQDLRARGVLIKATEGE